MAEVSWSPRAVRDLEDIRRYVSLDNPLIAQRLAVRLGRAADGLAHMPERGQPASGGARELTIIYPYLIRYRGQKDLVRIVRIKHGARRPG